MRLGNKLNVPLLSVLSIISFSFWNILIEIVNYRWNRFANLLLLLLFVPLQNSTND